MGAGIRVGDTVMGYTRIDKREARKMYENGGAVCMIASKLRIGSTAMGNPAVVGKHSGRSFEQAVNEFKYYNCNPTCGNEVHFYKRAGV